MSGGEVNYNKGGNTGYIEKVSPGVSIGGGTGATGGGSVTLNISGQNTILRTGSIGGGKITGSGNIGSANVKITGGDITGQVVMAKGADTPCSFEMSGGRIHGTNLLDGNFVEESITDPQRGVKIQYLEKNGGAVWMDDPKGDTSISGGTIESCTAKLGGAIYMKGGTFTLSGEGKIQNNTAMRSESSEAQGYGGGVYVEGGNANIGGGYILKNDAQVRGGGLYVKGGDVTVSGGSISENTAGFGENIPADVGRGGGVYLEGGKFTMTGGEISNNTANYRGGGIFLTQSPILTEGTISGNTAKDSGGGLCINGDKLELTSQKMRIFSNAAKNGGGVAVLNGEFILNGGNVGVEPAAPDAANVLYNTASEKGGGVYVANEGATSGATGNAARVTVGSGNIWYNVSQMHGGGVYLESGEFTMNGETGATASIQHNTAEKDGGGVYLKSGNFNMNGQNVFIQYNTAAQDGGGVYLESGNFTMDGEGVFVEDNTADRNGGGIYLHTNPKLQQGIIQSNTAIKDGGGMYISDCFVTLSPTGNVEISKNIAEDGAGIYINRSSGGSGVVQNINNGVDTVSSPTITQDAVGLLVDSRVSGNLSFTMNHAKVNGGAVCVNGGRFQLESDKITVAENTAEKGGGVAVMNGNFTMTNGSIGEKDRPNHAENGGGVYVTDGEAWIRGGSVQYNTATDGGGAYVTGMSTEDLTIRIVMTGGSIVNNTADRNGGGAYAAGNFRMLGGTVGGEGGGNSAKNGGGVYVSEGNVYVISGEISHNVASNDGGGFFVSATDSEVEVEMLSGSLSHNKAEKNGGGMSVESSNDREISVKIGCLLNHKLENATPKLPIDYTEAYVEYGSFDGQRYQHNSCPVVQSNHAGNIGGGFYMNSDDSTLSFYCVEETGNTAAKGKENSEGMDVEGGKVIIGDEHYHNHKHDSENTVDQHVVPWGYISMDNATLVNGGQVDIYGDMVNPVFSEEVTVDIKDKNKDHFMDHRRALDNEESYKVHYIENFFGTGLYQALQYDGDNTVITIEGALYSHPGYEILGWYTKADYDPTVNDPDNKFYPVGETYDLKNRDDVPQMGTHSINCDICGVKENDSNLLELYAIWEANGYTVIFDPNVPPGEPYTGKMDDQIHQYGVKQALTQNTYEYPGHFFKGWCMKQNPADGERFYGDKEEVSNLTEENGVKVVLYAQWDTCDHKDPERWSYEVSDDKKTLRRICSCGGQTLTATLSAEDTVYDGHSHPAEMVLDDPDAWGEDAPEIVYTGEWLEDGLTHTNTSPKLNDENKPFHAGVYTASITKQGVKQNEAAIVSVMYTIAKADQVAPAKPTYTVPEGASGAKVRIEKLSEDTKEFTDAAGHNHKQKAEYCLTYHGKDNITWYVYPENGNLEIPMNTALTSYIVAARYKELEDYNPSEITKADAVYYFAGDVTVKVECDDGINYEIDYAGDTNGINNGLTLKLTTDKVNYYLVDGDYAVTAKLKEKDSTDATNHTVNKETVSGEKSEYSIQDIPNNSTLTITIGKTRKIPRVTAKVAPKQKFSTFTGVETTISRDSAFTAAYQVKNYDTGYKKEDGKIQNVYTGLNLTFNQEIPVNTTIILLNREKNGEKTYWYYCAQSAITSVSLTAFMEMGGGKNYTIPQNPENGYVDLSYQFIVDFSQSGGYTGDNLTMKLEALIDNNLDRTNVPAINSEATVSMANPAFKLTKAENGLTCNFECSFIVASDAPASKWENRASALILTPENGIDLPLDARIKAVTDNRTIYLYKNVDSFIVPLSLLQTGDKKVELTLQSSLFSAEEKSYAFTAKWLISPSRTGKAPAVGYTAGTLDNVTFISPERKVPSLKPTGQQRVLTAKERLKLQIATANMDGYSISAALLRKAEDGTYIGTGWTERNVSGNLNVPLGSTSPGSYCLMFTVKEPAPSVTVVMEVPYHFVIKEAQ